MLSSEFGVGTEYWTPAAVDKSNTNVADNFMNQTTVNISIQKDDLSVCLMCVDRILRLCI